MSNLSFKTRGMTDPKGKQKVYFSCHPDDLSVWFEEISNEILKLQNCSVWYTSGNADVPEEHFFELGQMQLFVFPITARLLCQPNFALEKELAFALEYHIPVLPIMTERGLEELYGKKFGDLQYLDKTNSDPTAINYEEKLKNYLSAVLIGDELAKKIRSAFDAYVFLSYRKKDRRYARELMRLIHKNDFCRDIAIWYDEFLTPGEDFGKSIKEALDKSELFVLAVTPNLVNETNYIMTTEYPMAVDSQKPILPAELVPTDRELLAQKYDGIPTCADAYNDEELKAALLERVKALAIRENDSPEHNFFIGLAYLGGVDVEVDHERAMELITSSANAGLIEAVSKLVEMYREGIAVERNYETAITWQEKKIGLLKKIYEADKTSNNLNKLLWAIIECGDYIKELGKLQRAKEKYEETLLHISKSPFADTDLYTMRNLSVSYNRLGDILMAEGDISGAKVYYEKSLATREKTAEETGTVEARRDLAVSYNKLGDIVMAEGDISGTKAYYEKSLNIAEKSAAETGTVEAHRDLSVSYNKLGDILKAEGNISGAKAYHEKSLAIREKTAEETGTAQARRDLSIGYSNLGNILKSEGDISGAKAYHEKSLAIREKSAEETGTVEARRDLGVSYSYLGDILMAEGDISGAKAYYEKSLAIFEKLAEETGIAQSRKDLTIVYRQLGDIFKAKIDILFKKMNCKELLTISDYFLMAKTYYEKSLAISEKLAEELGTPENWENLATSYFKIGSVSSFRKRKYLKKSIAIYESLCKSCPNVARYQNNLNALKSMLK